MGKPGSDVSRSKLDIHASCLDLCRSKLNTCLDLYRPRVDVCGSKVILKNTKTYSNPSYGWNFEKRNSYLNSAGFFRQCQNVKSQTCLFYPIPHTTAIDLNIFNLNLHTSRPGLLILYYACSYFEHEDT